MEFADYPNPVPISDPGPLKSISTRPPSLSSRNPRRRPAFTAGGRDFGVWWLRARVSCEVFANKDIFMYRGDTPFCSEECKQQQIEMDEANEKNWKIFASMKALRIDQKKPNKSFSPKKTQNYAFLLFRLYVLCLKIHILVQEKLLDEPSSANDDTKQAADSSINDGSPEYPSKNFNKQIAVVSTLAAVGLFLSTRLDLGVSLKDLSAMALPYEEALSNGKPTVVEFYADWCEVCRELAPDVYKVEQQYKDRVNFVMLNVDNTKWEQELDEFGVEGIPHFAFLDKNGNEEGNVVGRLPRQYFLENVDAIARGEASIPHARVVGQYSSAEARKAHQVVDPRSHG
ncbi:hypothetical protein HYC85_002475 [Camellia sinensis]|uniref:Thioredoxin-like protein HCF164, chloroplastic n=1 Tax=Camellia sinensis TaxID=4442 RepID=A0A7J7I9S8_CAMSI|nr:hypothetical protein HYC85_002475 [Camellia sinensis]